MYSCGLISSTLKVLLHPIFCHLPFNFLPFGTTPFSFNVILAGIGRAVAMALSKGGATVHGISRTESDLNFLNEEVNFYFFLI